MAMVRAQIEIGKRAYEEVLRIFPKITTAKRVVGASNHRILYDWMNGCAPSAKYLQRLYYCGADVIYILTGKRSKNEN